MEASFPSMRCINLGRREDRRNEVTWQFYSQDLPVERFPAVNVRTLTKLRGHRGAGQYGCALSHRMILREAKLAGHAAVLIFEDDVVLHPDFRRLAEALTLPEDWGIFYFGCLHVSTPQVIAPGIVKVTGAWTTHAYAVRARYFLRVRTAMRNGATGKGVKECDVVLAELADEIPTYAAYPNLAWQSAGASDIMNVNRCQFDQNGIQGGASKILGAVDEEMRHLLSGAKTAGPTTAM